MKFRKLSALVVAGMVSLSIATTIAQDAVLPATDPAIATMAVADLVEARQEAMRENGGILRNAASLSGADAVTAARTLIENFTNLPHMYPEGSIAGDSKAKPEIWTNWDTFVGYFAEGRTAAEAALVAAEAGDTAAFQAALGPIGPLCGQCHQQFRQ